MNICGQPVRSDAYLFWIILQVINEVVEGPASIYVILSTLKVVSLLQDLPPNEPKMYSRHRDYPLDIDPLVQDKKTIHSQSLMWN